MKIILFTLCVLFLVSCSSNDEEIINISEKWVQENILTFYTDANIDSEIIRENKPRKEKNDNNTRFEKSQTMIEIENYSMGLKEEYKSNYIWNSTLNRSNKDIAIYSSIENALHKSTLKGYDKLKDLDSPVFYEVFVPFDYTDSILGIQRETIGIILSDKLEVLNSKITYVTKLDSIRNLEITYIDIVE